MILIRMLANGPFSNVSVHVWVLIGGSEYLDTNDTCLVPSVRWQSHEMRSFSQQKVSGDALYALCPIIVSSDRMLSAISEELDRHYHS